MALDAFLKGEIVSLNVYQNNKVLSRKEGWQQSLEPIKNHALFHRFTIPEKFNMKTICYKFKTCFLLTKNLCEFIDSTEEEEIL